MMIKQLLLIRVLALVALIGSANGLLCDDDGRRLCNGGYEHNVESNFDGVGGTLESEYDTYD